MEKIEIGRDFKKEEVEAMDANLKTYLSSISFDNGENVETIKYEIPEYVDILMKSIFARILFNYKDYVTVNKTFNNDSVIVSVGINLENIKL